MTEGNQAWGCPVCGLLFKTDEHAKKCEERHRQEGMARVCQEIWKRISAKLFQFPLDEQARILQGLDALMDYELGKREKPATPTSEEGS